MTFLLDWMKRAAMGQGTSPMTEPQAREDAKRKLEDNVEPEPVSAKRRKHSSVERSPETRPAIPIAWVQLPHYDDDFLAQYAPDFGHSSPDSPSAASTAGPPTPAPATPLPTSPKVDDSSRNLRRRTRAVNYAEQVALDDSEDENDKTRHEIKVTRNPSQRSHKPISSLVDSDDDFDNNDEKNVSSDDLASEDDMSSSVSATGDEGGSGSGSRSKSKVRKAAPKLPQNKSVGTRTTSKRMTSLLSRAKGVTKGLDESLPPLSRIEDIFQDLTEKALSLGLDESVKQLGRRQRPLRVATMCSGTESPLLALEMIADSLKAAGHRELLIEHVFSAEIVPFKQAYIERNFAPAIIFRDITELTSAMDTPEPRATTVYGARVPVPRNIDIVIAGTSCVDFSRLNNQQKGLDDGGESGDTWNAVRAFCRVFKPKVVVLENIKTAHWDVMIEDYEKIGYQAAGVHVDTKDFYLPQTRQRGYMVAFDNTSDLDEEIGEKWTSLMASFRRFSSAPISSFMQTADKISVRLQDEQPFRDVDWAKCAITQMAYRQTQRLGNLRPITHWRESGTSLPPENGNAAWYKRQVQRVLDTIDCAHLRNALPSKGAFDSNFKTRMWDLSQNIYREQDHRPFGISGCITPSGLFFVSDAGRIATAEELMILQGLPLDKISFTTESPADIQDLAGNAMSTPVVGSAVLAALICATPQGLLDLSESEAEACPASRSDHANKVNVINGNMKRAALVPSVESLRSRDVLAAAKRSMRRCFCEGSKGSSKFPIQRCLDCGHTTCTACGGNPIHRYQRADEDEGRLDPTTFEDQLKELLPLQLKFESAQVSQVLKSLKHSRKYAALVEEATLSSFTLTEIRRTHCWTVIYRNSKARLELVIEDDLAEWRMFADIPRHLSSKDPLRTMLERPIARAKIASSILGDEWQWRAPGSTSVKIQIEADEVQVPSWWNRLGMPDFRNHNVPQSLNVIVPAESAGVSLGGTYEYLPQCGMASSSLFKKQDQQEGQPLYLFLDPTRTGDPTHDHFVFSHSKALLDYQEVRPVLARLEDSWRPWKMGKQPTATILTIESSWRSGSDYNCKLNLDPSPLRVQSLALDELKSIARRASCADALVLARCEISGVDMVDQIVTSSQDAFFTANAHMFEAMKRFMSASDWIELDGSQCHCHNRIACSPGMPETRWRISAEKLIPYDDPESAGSYERAIKARHDPVFARFQDSQLELCANFVALAHRAAARLPGQIESKVAHWRFLTRAQDISQLARRPFSIPATVGVKPAQDPLENLRLFPKQRLALAWMKNQEQGVKFLLEEIVDAKISFLNWRAEARVQGTINVRGGICADHPGFGKTVTSLALIHSEFKDLKPDAMIKALKARQTGSSIGLIPSSATLIVSPTQLVRQWVDEIRTKLGYTKGVIKISTARDLSSHSVEDFKTARIIVVNRKIFGSDGYIDRLATFGAVPPPFTSSGRSFEKWLEFVSKEIPAHLQIMLNQGVQQLGTTLKQKYQDNSKSEAFMAVMPSKRLRGKAYAEKSNKASCRAEKKLAGSLDTTTAGKPLFEMFFFNRLIADEFHENDAKEIVNIHKLQADKRWGLSATPAMDDAYDVAQMARLLGIPLRIGSAALGLMKKRNRTEMRKDMTQFQLFDAMRDLPSDALHSRILEHAQEFIDTFVRQNVMDSEIPYDEYLIPVTLDMKHRALYTETSQHLNSLDMQTKKNTSVAKSIQTERDKIYSQDLALSATAEGILSCKAAFLDDDASIEAIAQRREKEGDAILDKVRSAIERAQRDEQDAFNSWSMNLEDGALGDDEVTKEVLGLLGSRPSQTLEKLVRRSSKPSKKSSDDDDEEEDDSSAAKLQGKRDHTAVVNTMCNQLLVARRSARYLHNLIKVKSNEPSPCDDHICQANQSGGDGLKAVSAYCGHVICRACYTRMKRHMRTLCPADGCSSSMHDYHLLWSSKMGHSAQPKSHYYGAKIGAALDLMRKVREQDEQAIIFVQFANQVEELRIALRNARIPALVVASDADFEKIEDFKKASSEEAAALVLNVSDRTASGSNLQNANHVIFLSPLLKNSQYEYEATMAQAIGRVRRPGQQRAVHVHRIVALDTIDVDILEHRERRVNALTERGAPHIKAPSSLPPSEAEPKPGRTQLVRDEKGRFSLQPRTWLAAQSKEQGSLAHTIVAATLEDKGEVSASARGRVPGYDDFSSLIKFSKAYAEGDE